MPYSAGRMLAPKIAYSARNSAGRIHPSLQAVQGAGKHATSTKRGKNKQVAEGAGKHATTSNEARKKKKNQQQQQQQKQAALASARELYPVLVIVFVD